MRLHDRFLTRRQMLSASLAVAGAAVPSLALGMKPGARSVTTRDGKGSRALVLPDAQEVRYPFSLPELPYATDALDAAIDARTMEIHHRRHHQGYVNRLNAALEGHPELHDRSLVELVSSWDRLPEEVRSSVRNHGGGHLNHSFFWPSMTPSGGGEPGGVLAGAIRNRFGSFSAFREAFSAATGSVFGSGWGWLVADEGNGLEIVTTANQDNPVSMGMTPLLGLDVWEHAYYLRYQNRRGDYIQAFWDVVSWDEIERRFQAL